MGGVFALKQVSWTQVPILDVCAFVCSQRDLFRSDAADRQTPVGVGYHCVASLPPTLMPARPWSLWSGPFRVLGFSESN